MSDTFSVRLPVEQTKFLDRMAKATDRSRNKIISGAVARIMENYEHVEKLIALGDKDFEEGRTVSHEDVIRRTLAIVDRVDQT
jgi:predicted transcriptional regulator